MVNKDNLEVVIPKGFENSSGDEIQKEESFGNSPDSPSHRSRESSISTRTEDEDDEEVVISWSVALRPRNLYKLVTHEDRFNIHKLLGVAVLTHFIFRLVSLVVRGTMGFEYESQTRLICWFGLHLLLSWSSFIFHLPARRNQVKPMIWPELRLHNIVFASRSVLDALCHIVGIGHLAFPRVFLAFAAMILADLVSNHYRKLELITNTTMRGMPCPKTASKSFIDRVNLYYGMSQLFATAGVLNISRNWKTDVELAFLTIFGVQISALLMTLVRKSALEPAGFHFFYGVALGFSWLLACWRYSETSSALNVFLRTVVGGYGLYYVRFHLNTNKYLMWTLFAVVDTFVFAKGYLDYPYDIPIMSNDGVQ